MSNKVPTYVYGVLLILVLLTIIRLPSLISNEKSWGTLIEEALSPTTQTYNNDPDMISFPSYDCSKCGDYGYQCCSHEGIQSCLGHGFKCAQRSKQSCSKKQCPNLFVVPNGMPSNYNRLCTRTTHYYYYCSGVECASTTKCQDGSPAIRDYVVTDPIWNTSGAREIFSLTFFIVCSILFLFVVSFQDKQPLKARNIWLMIGEIVCSLTWSLTILNNRIFPCSVYIGTIIFSALFLSIAKICRIIHVMLSHNAENIKKQIQDAVYEQLIISVKSRENVVIKFEDDVLFLQVIDRYLAKYHLLKWYATWPLLAAPAAISAIITIVYLILVEMFFVAEVHSLQSCSGHKSIGIVIVVAMSTSIITYCCMVYFARNMTNTVIAFLREFSIDVAIFVCLSLLVSFCYIFTTINPVSVDTTVGTSSILSVNMVAPFTSLINIALMLGNSVGIPIGEIYLTNSNEKPVRDGVTIVNGNRLRRQSQMEPQTRTTLNHLSQVLRGHLSLELLKNYAATEYSSEYLLLWRLIDTYRNHQKTLRALQQEKLLTYLYHIYIGSEYRIRVPLPTLERTTPIKLDERTLYDIQMELMEWHLLTMYTRMLLIRRYEEQLQVLNDSGAMPPLEPYDNSTPIIEGWQSPNKDTSGDEDEEYSLPPFGVSLPGYKVILPHATSVEEPRI